MIKQNEEEVNHKKEDAAFPMMGETFYKQELESALENLSNK